MPHWQFQLDTSSMVFFVLQSAIVAMYENQALSNLSTKNTLLENRTKIRFGAQVKPLTNSVAIQYAASSLLTAIHNLPA